MDNYPITLEDVKLLSKHVTLEMFFAADEILRIAYNSLADEDIKQRKEPNHDYDYYYKAASAVVLYAGYVAGVRAERAKRRDKNSGTTE